MDNDRFDFDFDFEQIDRKALLEEAARRLDALGGYLGPTPTSPQTPEGDVARDLMDDVVDFSGFPVVYKITDKDFLTHNLNIPIRFKDLSQAFNFYWVYFPIALFPKHNWGFNRLDIGVKFNPDEPIQHLRPKAYQILPEKKFQTLIETSMHLEVHIDENFEFNAQAKIPHVNLGPAGGKLDAGVNAKVAGGLGSVVGPFVYRMKRAKIDHTPIGMEQVFWRLDGTEYFQDDDPPLIVILQVPKEIREVKLAAALRAFRYFNRASASFQQAVRELPLRVQTFITQGMPVDRKKAWDITPRL
jgi:hypothetical protein